MEVDEFLEHHGVKGMHWGVRNLSKGRTEKTNNSKRNKRIIKGVAISSIVIGAATVAIILKRKSNLKIKEIARLNKQNKFKQAAVKTIIRNAHYENQMVLQKMKDIQSNIADATREQVRYMNKFGGG